MPAYEEISTNHAVAQGRLTCSWPTPRLHHSHRLRPGTGAARRPGRIRDSDGSSTTTRDINQYILYDGRLTGHTAPSQRLPAMIFPLGRAANPAEPRLLEDRITANQKSSGHARRRRRWGEWIVVLLDNLLGQGPFPKVWRAPAQHELHRSRTAPCATPASDYDRSHCRLATRLARDRRRGKNSGYDRVRIPESRRVRRICRFPADQPTLVQSSLAALAPYLNSPGHGQRRPGGGQRGHRLTAPWHTLRQMVADLRQRRSAGRL